MKDIFSKIECNNVDKILDKALNKKSIKTITCVNQYYYNLIYVDNKYREIINEFDLIFGDGIGMQLAIRILKKNCKKNEYVTGSDLYLKLLKNFNENKKKVFLFGDRENILNIAEKKLVKMFPNIQFVGKLNGYIKFINDEKVIRLINQARPDVIFVGLGPMRQEQWVIENKDKIFAEKIIVVGGWFRVVAGDRKRGSNRIRKSGLEWFIRLITEPKYVWKRYLIGIPLFIYRIIILKFINNIKKNKKE